MFNLKDVEIKNDFDVLPAGTYSAYVDRVEWKTSKAGAEYLSAGFKTFGGDNDGRYVWHMWNLMHPKDQVKDIALQDIKRLFIAAKRESELEGDLTKEKVAEIVSNCRVKIKVNVKTDDYGTKNVIKGYEELQESSRGMPTPDGVDASSIPF